MGKSIRKAILAIAAVATVAGHAAAQNVVVTEGAFMQNGEFVVNDGVNLRNITVEQSGDQVSVEFDVVVDGRNISSKESMTIIPVVKGHGDVQLPTVLINGPRRAAIYVRAQALARGNREPEPGLLMTARSGRTTTGHYSHTFKVTPQLEGATLSVESFSATCCTESPHSQRRMTGEPLRAWVEPAQPTQQAPPLVTIAQTTPPREEPRQTAPERVSLPRVNVNPQMDVIPQRDMTPQREIAPRREPIIDPYSQSQTRREPIIDPYSQSQTRREPVLSQREPITDGYTQNRQRERITDNYYNTPTAPRQLDGVREIPRWPIPQNEVRQKATWLEPAEEQVKRRESSIVARIGYPQGSSVIRPDYGSNMMELARIEQMIAPLFGSHGQYEIRRVRIDGYASIEGQYYANDDLARRRAEGFGRYLYERYGMRTGEVAVYSHGEDWEGLKELIRQDGGMPYGRIAEQIIDYVGVFDGRERELMSLDQGVPYRYMYRYFFPLLRRMEITFEYDVQAFDDREAERMMQTRPGDLSHAEMLRLMRRAGADEREMYTVLAELFPEDAVAQINAASAELVAGNSEGAREYLRRVEGDPRAAGNLALYQSLTGVRLNTTGGSTLADEAAGTVSGDIAGLGF
jgi:outer membrane protein OmpA-like peptidoglycan-associated protein